MCTVSIIPLRFAAQRGQESIHGFRLVTNRDENRARAAAVPPRWVDVGDGGRLGPESPMGRLLCPADAAAGGTWVGVTDRGMALCLLNGNPRPYPAMPPVERLVSRGAIVPMLSGEADATAVAEVVGRLDLERFAPFALLAVDLPEGGESPRPPRVMRVQWDRRELSQMEYPAVPVCAVSSGLGDERVTPRLGLFERLVGEGDAMGGRSGQAGRAEAQDRFHRHVWRDRPEISVLMSRSDARTVSITTVEVVAARPAAPARISMVYQPIHETGVFGSPVVHRTAVGAPVRAAVGHGLRRAAVAEAGPLR